MSILIRSLTQASLASIHSEEEAKFVLERIPDREQFWIDGRRLPELPDGKAAWIWTDGTKMLDCYDGFCLPWTNKGTNNSDCLHLGGCYESEDDCHDWDYRIQCDTKLGYICKKLYHDPVLHGGEPCDSKCPKPDPNIILH